MLFVLFDRGMSLIVMLSYINCLIDDMITYVHMNVLEGTLVHCMNGRCTKTYPRTPIGGAQDAFTPSEEVAFQRRTRLLVQTLFSVLVAVPRRP